MEENKNLDKVDEIEKDKEKNMLERQLIKQLENLNYAFNKNRILDLIDIMGNTKALIFRNITSGIAKGIGIGIGVTIITAVIIYLLQKVIKLNIPIISQYISDVVEIVQNTKK